MISQIMDWSEVSGYYSARLNIHHFNTYPPHAHASNVACMFLQVFKQVPGNSEKRKDALQGAIKIKKIASALTQTIVRRDKPLQGVKPEEAPDAGGASAAAVATPPVAVLGLESLQSALSEAVTGLLQLSFPVEEELLKDSFADVANTEAALARLITAVNLAKSLSDLFEKIGTDPSTTSASTKSTESEKLPPELLQMLTKAMSTKQPEREQARVDDTTKKARKIQWMKSGGRMSQVVGEDVWEALNFRLGTFGHMYIRSRVATYDSDVIEVPMESIVGGEGDIKTFDQAKVTAVKSVLPPLALFDDTIRNFHLMQRARGPISSDFDDPATWNGTDDAGGDNTEKLFYHGIYSSEHLLGLKFQAELSYWRHKYFPEAPDFKDHWQFTVSTLHKFVHVIDTFMKGTGWTCEVERKWLLEIRDSELRGAAPKHNE